MRGDHFSLECYDATAGHFVPTACAEVRSAGPRAVRACLTWPACAPQTSKPLNFTFGVPPRLHTRCFLQTSPCLRARRAAQEDSLAYCGWAVGDKETFDRFARMVQLKGQPHLRARCPPLAPRERGAV